MVRHGVALRGATARFGDVARGLEQQCRLANARLAGDQYNRPGHNAATEHTVEFAEAGGDARHRRRVDLRDRLRGARDDCARRGAIAKASSGAAQRNTVLYISGEESQAQVRLRASRIGAGPSLVTWPTSSTGTSSDLAVSISALATSRTCVELLPTPRRAVNGVDTNRIAMLVAVLYRHGGLALLTNDLYISTIAGGMAKEPACDLAICAALASAATNVPMRELTSRAS